MRRVYYFLGPVRGLDSLLKKKKGNMKVRENKNEYKYKKEKEGEREREQLGNSLGRGPSSS